MNKDDHLQRHLDLCRRIYLRMLADGTWPWKEAQDSRKSEDLLDFGDTTKDV